MDNSLPRHIAIIMDGNGRWAKKRFLPRYAGHRTGAETVRKIIKHCSNLGVEVLTLFAFSSENWRRPPTEVKLLMDLFMTSLRAEVKKLHKNNIRLRVIGDCSAFSDKLQAQIQSSEQLTANNTGMNVLIAANYGGQWDISQAVQQLARDVQSGDLAVEDINPQRIQEKICGADLPLPDLFIRTGGDQRISNFLLWQLAYTELYFTPTLWPDFTPDALQLALNDYAGRQRRFGKTGEQVN